MASTPHQCPGTTGKTCSSFLPVKDEGSHTLCISCCGKSCTVDERCWDCHDSTVEKWEKVSTYHEELAIH